MSIHSVSDLQEHLQFALMVEHFTIPPYLCALYSIREGGNREAAAVIQTVVMEEMLHMVLVANLLNAVGGKPRLNHPAFIPTYPDYLPHSARSFQVPLQRFSRAAIGTFMRIEKPEGTNQSQDDYYSSIGAFYEAVRKALESLCDTPAKEKAVFCGDRKRQVTPEYYYGGAGRVIEVHDLETALRAIEEIVYQGEGAPGSVFDNGPELRKDGPPDIAQSARQVAAKVRAVPARTARSAFRQKTFSGYEEPAHYYRFRELHDGRYYQAGDTLETGPTGPEIPLQWDAVYPMGANPKAANFPAGSPIRVKLDDFNRCYVRLLYRLEQAFNGQQKLLVPAAGDMYEIKHRAQELMRIPSGHGDTTVGPSFEYIDPGKAPL